MRESELRANGNILPMGLALGGCVYAWEDGYQPGPNQAEPGLCEYDRGHI